MAKGSYWRQNEIGVQLRVRGNKSENDKPSRWSVRGWSEFDEGDRQDDTKRRGEWNCVFQKHMKVSGMKETMSVRHDTQTWREIDLGSAWLDSTFKEAEHYRRSPLTRCTLTDSAFEEKLSKRRSSHGSRGVADTCTHVLMHALLMDEEETQGDKQTGSEALPSTPPPPFDEEKWRHHSLVALKCQGGDKHIYTHQKHKPRVGVFDRWWQMIILSLDLGSSCFVDIANKPFRFFWTVIWKKYPSLVTPKIRNILVSALQWN